MFDTSVCQSPCSAHTFIYTHLLKKNNPNKQTNKRLICTVQKFLDVDESALREREHPVKQKCILLIRYPIVPVTRLCVFNIYTCLGTCTLLSLAALSNIQHRRCTNPEFMSEGDQGGKEAGAVNGPRFKKKTRNKKREKGSTRVEPLNTGDLLSSDKTHVTLTLQRLSLDAGFSLFPHPRCVIMSPGCEKRLALKLPSTKYMKKNSPGV